jgi:hypothetical protein
MRKRRAKLNMLNQLNELNGVESLRSFRGKIGKAGNEEAVIFLSETGVFSTKAQRARRKDGFGHKERKRRKDGVARIASRAKRFIASRGA